MVSMSIGSDISIVGKFGVRFYSAYPDSDMEGSCGHQERRRTVHLGVDDGRILVLGKTKLEFI